MYRIMIVDDETSIRNGLKNIIDWEDLGIEIVCEAANGKEALLMMDICKPTIVLTDIKMPEMDGIELLRQISTSYPNVKVVMLSGFDEFEYVRAAMRLGAANYLLKPVDTEELISAMREILDGIGTEVQDFLKYREFLQLLQKNTLNRIISNQISLKELREKCEMLGVSFQSDTMYVAVLQLSIQDNDHWKIFAALNICDELIHTPENCYIFPDNRNNIVFIFKNELDVSRINRRLEDCICHIRKYLETESVASFGSLAASHRDLGESYKCALRLLNYQLLYGLGKVYSLADFDIGDAPSPQQQLFENMMSLIEKCDKEAAQRYIDDIFDELASDSRHVDPNTVKYSVVDIISYVLYQMESYNISPVFLQNIKKEVYTKLQTLTHADQLKEMLIGFSDEMIEKIKDTSLHNYSYTVKKAIDYIDDKYYDYNISLKTLGDTLNINPAYLGRLFRQETNQFFSDYLNNRRIQKAKELLQTSGLKASEIAEKVGFSSISYFYTVFKKITGQNPGDIRK